MNLFRTLRGTAFFLLTGAALTSCFNAPDYPVEPSIDFKEVQVKHIPAGVEDAVDELTFVLNFRDGDGDLGIADITAAPFNEPPTPAAAARNHLDNQFNYIIQPYKLDVVSGRFLPYQTPDAFGRVGQYDGTFPPLDVSSAKPSPLKGELRYRFPIGLDGTAYKAGDVFQFELTILDRNLHVSNTVTTTPVTLGQ